jgi:hypothetical protein
MDVSRDSCSSFYDCVRDAYELAESVAGALRLIIDAMDYGDVDVGDAALDTVVLLRQVVADLYCLVARVRKAVKMVQGSVEWNY